LTATYNPSPVCAVTAFAKQTGDYAVLSHTDMCVLALTYAVEVEENGHWRVKDDLHKVRPSYPPLLPPA
jgi:RNA-binding protein NOB1